MKSIVIYYSYGGNTRKIAERIQKELGADSFEIETIQPYSGSYNDVVEQGQVEVNSGFMPEIKPFHIDLNQYDTIILGTPVWWYTFAPAMKTFLSNTDLSGKNIYSFATNGGWIGHTFKDIEMICTGAKVHKGLNIRFNEDKQITPDAEIQNWIHGIG